MSPEEKSKSPTAKTIDDFYQTVYYYVTTYEGVVLSDH